MCSYAFSASNMGVEIVGERFGYGSGILAGVRLCFSELLRLESVPDMVDEERELCFSGSSEFDVLLRRTALLNLVAYAFERRTTDLSSSTDDFREDADVRDR